MSEDDLEETKGVIAGLANPAWTEGVLRYPDATRPSSIRRSGGSGGRRRRGTDAP